MHPWIEAAQEYGLNDITAQITDNENVHGVIIDLHPLWLYYWDIYLQTGREDMSVIDEDFFINYLQINNYYWRLPEPFAYFNTVVPVNLSWLPKHWGRITKKSNLVVKLLLKPNSKRVEIKYEGSMTLIQEHRPVPRMAALEGGVSMGNASNSPGTLGGILVDRITSKFYGLSCAHVIVKGQVADHPSLVDSKLASAIGTCVYSDHPTTNNGVLCNTHNPLALNEFDIALIEIDPSIAATCSIQKIGNLNGIAPGNQIAGNLKVEFTGRTSNHKILVTGGVGVIQQILFNNNTSCCFKELIELREPSMNRLYLNQPVRGGDSGAWVVTQGSSGTEWCAMIIAGDRQTGYAIPAESIMKSLANNGFPNLSCI